MKKTRFFLLLLCVCMLLTSCATASTSTYTKYSSSFFDTFDTLITLTAYAADQQTFDEAAQRVHERFITMHRLYDHYNAYDGVTNVYTLNQQAAKAPMQVDDLLFDLLMLCKEQQPSLHSKVNIAMGSVLDIWHRYRDAGLSDPQNAALPPMDTLSEASTHTNFDDVILDEAAQTVYFADPNLKLDLGAVAKGYAAEVVARELLSSPVSSFVLSAGGNVRAGNAPMDGRKAWGVGVQNPEGQVLSTARDDLIDVLYLADTSIVTSGNYQRYYIVDGVRYHHLIDPDTLMPGDFFPSVTIVTQDSGMADLLSTAVFLMPFDEGFAFVESLEGVEAMWILHDGSSVMTDGLKPYARSQGATSR